MAAPALAPLRAHRTIPFFDYPRLFTSEEEDLVAIFRDVGRRGAFILQQDLERFETNLAAFLGVRHVLGVANATDGLLIALRSAGIDSGEVVFCSHTMVATAAAIHFAGATPVPVDCGSDHLIDPAAIEAAITPRTRAILPTQLNGRTCDMSAILRISEQHQLLVIEDAAQALGSRFKGQPAGTFGTAAAFSFFPAKVLGCLGDGGAVVSKNGTIHERMAQLRDHGRATASGEIASWGLNSRLDNLQAAILDHRLQSFDHAIERRRALARIYRAWLEELDEIVLPPGPDNDPDHFDIFQNYEIEARDRDRLRAFLQSRGIGTIIPWGGKAVHQWEGLGLNATLPRTDRFFERLLLLPMNAFLADDDVDYICDSILRFYRS
jgi:dTDP-4-amino-4,6-dideoxygalactose transaminase